ATRDSSVEVGGDGYVKRWMTRFSGLTHLNDDALLTIDVDHIIVATGHELDGHVLPESVGFPVAIPGHGASFASGVDCTWAWLTGHNVSPYERRRGENDGGQSGEFGEHVD